MKEILLEVSQYLAKTIQEVRPLWVAFVSLVNYVLFPTDAYVPAVISVAVAAILDILTRYYAVCVQSGGVGQAVKSRKLSSNLLWEGTRKKLISYLVIMVLAGLSVRVTMLTSVAVFLSTIVYSIMFLRESQSVVENLIDAGHEDLEWLLFWLKRKQKDVLEKEGITDPVEATIETTKVDPEPETTNYDKLV